MKSELHKILEENSLFAKKKFGQNFLINSGILESIIEAAEIKSSDLIIEVGPGLGFLTNKLIPLAQEIMAVEIDSDLFKYLQNNFGKASNLQILNQDILKTDLPQKPYKLVANIPYYITSPIISHFFRAKGPQQKPQLAVLLVQKEVAQKICAKDGDHTILSLQTQIFGHPEIIKTVHPGSFYPAPKVDSAILKIKTYPQPLIDNFDDFFKLISAAFQQKRKTMANSLKNILHLSPDQIKILFEKSEISPKTRPQQLSISDWKKLTDIYSLQILKN